MMEEPKTLKDFSEPIDIRLVRAELIKWIKCIGVDDDGTGIITYFFDIKDEELNES